MAETIIEISGGKNDSVYWPITSDRLRGRWNSVHTAGFQLSPWLSDIVRIAPTIPGIHIALDIQERKARIFDPLVETDEGRELWAQLEPVYKSRKPGKVRLMDTSVFADLSDDAVKTWAFNMRSLLDGKMAAKVSGPELPSASEIRKKMPGRRETKLGSNYPWSDKERFTDTVPSKGEPANAK
jgi:hypothetical protein